MASYVLVILNEDYPDSTVISGQGLRRSSTFHRCQTWSSIVSSG